jgi:hypothetical protein
VETDSFSSSKLLNLRDFGISVRYTERPSGENAKPLFVHD